MILVEDLNSFKVLSTWINGHQVFDGIKVFLPNVDTPIINSFGISAFDKESLKLKLTASEANVIIAINGSLITGSEKAIMKPGLFESDIGGIF
jgi:adenine deaminase